MFLFLADRHVVPGTREFGDMTINEQKLGMNILLAVLQLVYSLMKAVLNNMR